MRWPMHRDFVAPTLKRRAPEGVEIAALERLDAELAALPAEAQRRGHPEHRLRDRQDRRVRRTARLVQGAVRDAARIEPGAADGQLHRALRRRQHAAADRRGAGAVTRGVARVRPTALRDFIASEAAGGIVLIAAAVLAMVVANSPPTAAISQPLHAETGPARPALGPMTVHLWINDAAMALFFLLVGLEIKREFVDGRLATLGAAPPAVHRGGGGHGGAGAASISRSPAARPRWRAAGRSRRRPTSPSRSACWRCSASACPRRSSCC